MKYFFSILIFLSGAFFEADAQVQDYSYIFKSVEKGKIDVIEKYLQLGGDIELRNKKNQTLLHIAVREDELEMVKFLISKGADVNAEGGGNFFAGGKAARIPSLTFAIWADNLEIAEALINAGADINAFSFTFSNNSSALHDAAQWREIETVEFLISKGANVNIQNSDGDTPLHLNLERTKKGFSGDTVSDNSRLNNKRAFALIQAGANINIENSKGQTPLHFAAFYQRDKVVNALIQLGANIDIQDVKGNTPLHYAVSDYPFLKGGDDKGDNKKVLKLLIEAGARPNITNVEGQTPLALAKDHENKGMVKYLLKLGVTQ